jgi:hypothetical protein
MIPAPCELERRRDVVALYVDPRGPYPALVAEWFDLARDARNYEGPWPLVAHPPCAPWPRLRHFSSGAGRDCGPRSIEQVRCFGGIVEHPADSALWRWMDLPRPYELQPDSFGGRTVALYQGDYGHPAPKLTWLYCVGLVELEGLRLGRGTARGRVASMWGGGGARSITPQALARVLLDLAARALVR